MAPFDDGFLGDGVLHELPASGVVTDRLLRGLAGLRRKHSGEGDSDECNPSEGDSGSEFLQLLQQCVLPSCSVWLSVRDRQYTTGRQPSTSGSGYLVSGV